MNARERVRYYAQETGLTQREIGMYRTTPISGWTTRRDRQIGGVIRSLERMYGELANDLEGWMNATIKLLATVGDFVAGALRTAAAFAEKVAEVVQWLSDLLRRYPTVGAILQGLATWLTGGCRGRALPAG